MSLISLISHMSREAPPYECPTTRKSSKRRRKKVGKKEKSHSEGLKIFKILTGISNVRKKH
jgi:hypothetical protein